MNLVANIYIAPKIGRFVARMGERNALILEYVGLIGVFCGYAVVQTAEAAAALYILDHLFFAFSLAIKTYFQKIADPGDIAPTAAVAFTINHIAAVFLPFLLGLLWLVSPGAVFGLAAGMALVSLLLALMIPRHPEPGHETIFTGPAPVLAE